MYVYLSIYIYTYTIYINNYSYFWLKGHRKQRFLSTTSAAFFPQYSTVSSVFPSGSWRGPSVFDPNWRNPLGKFKSIAGLEVDSILIASRIQTWRFVKLCVKITIEYIHNRYTDIHTYHTIPYHYTTLHYITWHDITLHYHTYRHACMHAYIHTYIHIHVYIYIICICWIYVNILQVYVNWCFSPRKFRMVFQWFSATLYWWFCGWLVPNGWKSVEFDDLL